MEKKYKLTEEICYDFLGIKLYRIEALKDFGIVKKGDKGGYIENENNLSQEGDCWIYGNTKVSDKAIVCGNAQVSGNAQVFGNATVYGNALVYGNAKVFDDAKVYDGAKVYGDAIVSNNAIVVNKAIVCGNAKVFGNAVICDNALVYGNAVICDNALVFGNAEVYGYVQVCGSAEIKDNSDYIVFKNWWSSGRYFTWTRSNNMWRVGCFYGTGKELIAKAYEDSELSGREYKIVVNYVEAMLQNTKK